MDIDKGKTTNKIYESSVLQKTKWKTLSARKFQTNKEAMIDIM